MKNKQRNIFIIIITIISLIIRVIFIKHRTIDFEMYLEEWFNFIKNNNGIYALKYNIGDYNSSYLQIIAILTYLPINSIISIKMVSICFDYFLAFFSAILVSKIIKENKEKYMIITYMIIVLLPTILIDSAIWGQCDSIYTTFVIISLIKLIDKEYFKSIIFVGIAFSFKLQAVFIMPVFIILFLSNKELIKKIYYFTIIPLINIICCLPSIILGRNIKDVIMIYFSQAKEYNGAIAMNISNFYCLLNSQITNRNVIENIYEFLPKIMILFIMAFFGLLLIIVLIKKLDFNKKDILRLALYSTLISAYFLPFMHERYLYLSEILCIIIAIVSCETVNKKEIIIDIVTSAIIMITTLNLYIEFILDFKIYFLNLRLLSIMILYIILVQTFYYYILINKEEIGIIKK